MVELPSGALIDPGRTEETAVRTDGFLKPFADRAQGMTALISMGTEFSAARTDTSPWWVRPASGATELAYRLDNGLVSVRAVSTGADFLTDYVMAHGGVGFAPAQNEFEDAESVFVRSHSISPKSWFGAAMLNYWLHKDTFPSSVGELLSFYGLQRNPEHQIWRNFQYHATEDTYYLSYLAGPPGHSDKPPIRAEVSRDVNTISEPVARRDLEGFATSG